jgi:cytochrome c-type biogenesis protein CcmF
MIFNGFDTNVNDPRYEKESGDIAVSAVMSVYNAERKLVQQLRPVYFIRKQYEYQVDDTLHSANIFVHFSKVLPQINAAEIKVKQVSHQEDYITLKAIVFPYINVLWLGVIVMVLGFFISMWKRINKVA